ncbi:hypothetical protein [Selenomonas sp.]|uniref:hypothetical protein n=1 Tax=Selenomonas sp. TaxID=2053611 RepID=UPI0025EC18F0|nr:hypothetical protein [Selenomonas sp.]MCI6084885.1 hypothetical protein [Selenomonas sp.]MCI6284513.1 hypothetical protein [Selenomonas sp.]
MAIHRMTLHAGDQPPASAIAEAERAAQFPINFDDAPEMTDAQIARAATLARGRRAAMQKKQNITIRVPQQTINKAKRMLGAGYTGVLRRLIVKAVDHPELLKDCL